MTKKEKDQYWLELIQQCRVSGLSDKRWCDENGISSSSFYYNIRRLRQKAAAIPVPTQRVLEDHEVVPIHFNQLVVESPQTPKQESDFPAIRLTFHGVSLEINNNADSTIITATLAALRQLC